MTLARYDLIAKRTRDVMEPRKSGAWVEAEEALRAVSDARVAGQRMALDEIRGWIRHMSVGNRNAGWLAALDEMGLHIDAAWSRLDMGEPITGTSEVDVGGSAETDHD